MPQRGVKSEKDSLIGVEDTEGQIGDLGTSLRQICLAGGIYVFSSIPVALVVFLRPKILAAPHGFSSTTIEFCQALIWIGWALGAVTWLPYCDRIGRRTPMYCMLALGMLSYAVCSIASATWVYATANFCVGFAWPSAATTSYVLVAESIPSGWRPNVTVGLNVAYSIVLILMAVICEASQNLNWRLEGVFWLTPSLILLLIGPWFVTESPAFRVAGKAASLDMSSALATSGVAQDSDALRSPFFKLCRPPLLTSMLATCVCWMACSIGYYGLSYSSAKLSGNLYTSMLLLSLVDVFGYAIPAPLMRYLTPFLTQVIAFGIAGTALVISAFCTPKSQVELVFALTGRLGIDIAFTTIFVLIVECIPEKCRSTAIGAANFSARVGSVASPLLVGVSSHISCSILGLLCGVAAVCTLQIRHALPSEAAVEKASV
jgi:MFS family permease